ncbi:MAG: hypothetical protein HYX67_10425 [Candidatus Melainabacteria bacterium]|nr:hypothetical protein [Candidatus Melainabacteria bacterium]
MKKFLYAGLLSLVLVSTTHKCLAAGQDIKDASGGMFMEETTPTPPAAPKKNIPLDLSNVGVPVDPSGHIVPIIDRDAPGGVRQNFSNLEVYSEPAYNFIPAPVFNQYGQPYNFSGLPGVPYGGPFGYGGYGGFGGFGGFGGYPYGGGGIGVNLGKNFRLNLATPGPYGYGPYGGFGGPFGYGAPFGGGFSGATPFGVPGAGAPFGLPGVGFGGGPFGAGPFGYGGYGAPFGGPVAYSSPFGYGSPYGGSSLFSAQTRGLGLNLFVPNNVEWQSSSTITPLTPNLDGPP